ncbi:cysteine hydrolase [Luteolibacter sp. GHJ8]|uniref:Cysteine hydrolase n=1 Tax=Luteolibacter rhizosphaerae TaxID=2989719 RepID=A0ABT3FZG9_9BACT|nr:isochorismatase family cysteine hydrolase [Luteolibacter rhizosphaerae]MCW1912972.1 cysteine hydrolase [Luteolibacter rhizosphaerae]
MKCALLLIDVINDMDFPGGERLLKRALPAAQRLSSLRNRARAAGIPIIYVNDNFGRWNSDFQSQIRRCVSTGSTGKDVVSLLMPEEEDYFVLKPKHSGFYSSSLEVLLNFLAIDTLILSGFAADICVLYTANDAYMRDYHLIIASDCVASETDEGTNIALDHMNERLRAEVVLGANIDLRLCKEAPEAERTERAR